MDVFGVYCQNSDVFVLSDGKKVVFALKKQSKNDRQLKSDSSAATETVISKFYGVCVQSIYAAIIYNKHNNIFCDAKSSVFCFFIRGG